MSFFATLRADLAADGILTGSGPLTVARVLLRLAFAPRLQAVVLVRLAHSAQGWNPPLASFLKWSNHVLTGCDVASRAQIGPGLLLYHPVGVVIGPHVRIGARCIIQQGVTLGAGGSGSPTLGDDVHIGPGAKIMGGMTIGSGSTIGANAVVLGDVPERAMAAGVPATVRYVTNAAGERHRPPRNEPSRPAR